MARMWHGCQIITENKEWILFQQFEKYICGMCIFCQCPLMLKFSMESLLLVNDLEIWENLFFLTLKLVGKHPRLGKKKPSSVQVQHQQGVVPAKPYSCTQTSLLFGGHEGTEKDPVQKKKKRQTFNKQTNQTHKSSFYQHGSMKIQEKKKAKPWQWATGLDGKGGPTHSLCRAAHRSWSGKSATFPALLKTISLFVFMEFCLEGHGDIKQQYMKTK